MMHQICFVKRFILALRYMTVSLISKIQKCINQYMEIMVERDICAVSYYSIQSNPGTEFAEIFLFSNFNL